MLALKQDYLRMLLMSEVDGEPFIADLDAKKENVLIRSFYSINLLWLGIWCVRSLPRAYPEEYDHCQRPWYKEGSQKPGLTWNKPYFAINFNGLVLPCSYRRGGRWLGQRGFDCRCYLDGIVEKFMKYDDSKSQLFDEALILDGQGNAIISSKPSS